MHFGLGIAADLRVDQGFDLGQLLVADRLKMGKIKAQAIGRHQRTLLADMLAEHFAQRRMQQLGGGMVDHDRLPPIAIDVGSHAVTNRQRARLQQTETDVNMTGKLWGSTYPQHPTTPQMNNDSE